jgi:hypothetical protein
MEEKPIFELFNAELDTPAEEMVRVMKDHLREVLKAQEEVGRMHLALEGLMEVPKGKVFPGERVGGGGLLGKDEKEGLSGIEKGKVIQDPLILRERGVEEIMAKVGLISVSV